MGILKLPPKHKLALLFALTSKVPCLISIKQGTVSGARSASPPESLFPAQIFWININPKNLGFAPLRFRSAPLKVKFLTKLDPGKGALGRALKSLPRPRDHLSLTQDRTNILNTGYKQTNSNN